MGKPLRRVRGDVLHDERGHPVSAPSRPEKLAAGHALHESIKGRGSAVPTVPEHALGQMLSDISNVATLNEWEIERAVKGTHRTDGARAAPTARQLEFAQGLANGESKEEIAKRLGVRPQSVWQMLERLKFNVGAKTNYEVVSILAAAGLIDAKPLPMYATTVHVRKRKYDRRPERSRDALTRPELDILIRAADGMTMEETAADLGKAIETIKSQMKSMRAKLGARNIQHAIALGFRTGALEP